MPSEITGSTGAGRTPIPTTHHPERHSNLFAYQPLAHRHGPEVVSICEHLTGVRPRLTDPAIGPIRAGHPHDRAGALKGVATADALRTELRDFYAGSEFVSVVDGAPRLKDVVGSNYCHIGVTVDADTLAVMVVEDNLVKGAAGGAVQWLNRNSGSPRTPGSTAPAVGWT